MTAVASSFEAAQAIELEIPCDTDSFSCPDLDLDDVHLPCNGRTCPPAWREPRFQAPPCRSAPPLSVSVWRPPAA